MSTRGKRLIAASLVVLLTVAAPSPAGAARRSGQIHRCRAGRRHRSGPCGPYRGYARISARGRLSLPAAEAAYESTIGPLPGVHLHRPLPPPAASGSGAVRWLLSYAKRLTPRQLAAVERQSRGDGLSRAARASKAPSPQASPADQKKFETLLAEAIARIQQHLTAPWAPLSLKASVVLLTKQTAGEGVQAMTYARNASGGYDGAAKSCEVDVTPVGENLPLGQARSVMVHEAFHCFEAQLMGLKAFYSFVSGTPWLIEGAAAWADATVSSEWNGSSYADPSTEGYWIKYLVHPGVSLLARSYDAIGFYAQLAEQVADPWSAVGQMLLAGGSAAAFEKALALASPSFPNDLASGIARSAPLGPAWDFSGPQIPGWGPPIPVLTIAKGSTATVGAGPYANALARAVLHAAVVRVKVSPGDTVAGRLRSADGSEEAPLADGAYSTEPNGATCPNGTKGAGSSLPPLRSAAMLAVSGLKQGAKVVLHGSSLKEYCKKAPKLKSDLTFSGAVSGHTKKVGACSLDRGDFWHADFGLRMGDFYDFGIELEGFTGPGEYEVLGPGTRSKTVQLSDTDKAFRVFSTSYIEGPAGTVRVNGDLKSGTVEVAMRLGEGGPTENVSGTFHCG